MTKEQYQNRLYRIILPEAIGSVVCFGAALLILFNIDRLGTGLHLIFGIISVLILILLPVLSLRALKKMNSINIASNSYQETIIEYTKRKKQFLVAQKLGLYLCFVLVLISLPVAVKIMDGKDILFDLQIWSWYTPLGLIGLYFFARHVYRYYSNAMLAAEDVLKELN